MKTERDLLWKDIKGNALCPCGSGRKYKHCCKD
ncbi:MAG: SEC-C domain-containing protein [Butyrivibrio sp.]|nr:SEC-C domain-containing protein [Butyrivibrio sp.]